MNTPKPGQWFARQDGAAVRVDAVSDAAVYFVSWRPGQDIGQAVQMAPALFVEAIEKEEMTEFSK